MSVTTTTSSTVTSSQETRFSSQTSDDGYQVSSQDIHTLNGIASQEASSASDFIWNLTPSQIDTTAVRDHSDSSPKKRLYIDTDLSGDCDVKPNAQQLEGNANSTDGSDVKGLATTVEKRKRGRKRKIRSAEEMELHLKDKKEKNRLAAQRLRQRKCSEAHRYDKEVEDYEKEIKIRRNFVQQLESSVQQLRDRIKAMVNNHKNCNTNSSSNQTNSTNSSSNSSNHNNHPNCAKQK